MSSPVEQIKDRLHIVDVIASYIKLEKAGRNLKARCPFHNEKTPSFFVSPERDTFHCFGCQKGGDIFTFVEEIEGAEFKEALRILAERAGVAITGGGKEEHSLREKLFLVMEHAVLYYESQLRGNTEALAYLKDRGVREDIIKDFRIGFAPNEWRETCANLLAKGFTDRELEGAGLVIRKDNRIYDRFRGRIMFPLMNTRGRTIAFSGRILPQNALRKDGEKEIEVAKYINSPETPLFNKSNVLYGFDKAKSAMRAEDACVVVEGQMDVLMSHQGGVLNAVAASGTALTEEHLALISRFTDNLVLAFDADSAGFRASERAITAALLRGMNVLMIELPHGTDPADLVREDPKKWVAAVKSAGHIVDFFISAAQNKREDAGAFRKEIRRTVLPYVAHIENKIDQAHYVGKIARTLGLEEAPVWEELRKLEEHAPPAPYMRTHDAFGNKEKQTLDYQKKIEERILGLIKILKKESSMAERVTRAQEAFQELTSKDAESEENTIPPERLEAFFFEAEIRENTGTFEEELQELFRNLKVHILRTRLRKATNDLAYAEQKGDTDMAAEKLKECSRISKEINSASVSYTL